MTQRAAFDRVFRAMNLMEVVYAEADAIPGLTYRDVLYLDLITLDSECTVSKLASMLKVSVPTVSRRIKSMQDRGMVVLRRRDDDARFKVIEISDRFKLLMAEHDMIISNAVDSLYERYDGEQIALFCEMLDSMADRIDAGLEDRRRRLSDA